MDHPAAPKNLVVMGLSYPSHFDEKQLRELLEAEGLELQVTYDTPTFESYLQHPQLFLVFISYNFADNGIQFYRQWKEHSGASWILLSPALKTTQLNSLLGMGFKDILQDPLSVHAMRTRALINFRELQKKEQEAAYLAKKSSQWEASGADSLIVIKGSRKTVHPTNPQLKPEDLQKLQYLKEEYLRRAQTFNTPEPLPVELRPPHVPFEIDSFDQLKQAIEAFLVENIGLLRASSMNICLIEKNTVYCLTQDPQNPTAQKNPLSIEYFPQLSPVNALKKNYFLSCDLEEDLQEFKEELKDWISPLQQAHVVFSVFENSIKHVIAYAQYTGDIEDHQQKEFEDFSSKLQNHLAELRRFAFLAGIYLRGSSP